MVFHMDQFQDPFFSSYLLMKFIQWLSPAQCITLLMRRICSSSKNHSKKPQKMNRYINRDLKLIDEWIRAIKQSINTSKTELVIFKSRHKKITKHLNFPISGQSIQPSYQIKYLGVIIQDASHWTTHLVNVKEKLSRCNGLLSKIKHYVPKHLLRTIYYSLFSSHLIYACKI